MNWLKKLFSIFSKPKPHEEQEMERAVEASPFGVSNGGLEWREFLDWQLKKLRGMRSSGDKLFVAFSGKNGQVRVYRFGRNWLRAKEVYAAVAGNLYPGRMVVLKNDNELLFQARRPTR